MTLVVGGNGFCSGAMINNTDIDGTPYLLTANHCLNSNPGTWVFWFNWQSETCDNPGSSPPHDALSGSVLRARNADSDFCLVELNDEPHNNDIEVYYAGWNRVDSPNNSSVGIHHPSGDIKKISFDNDAYISSDYGPSPYLSNSHWQIVDWNEGTTEGGSSGSPLFNPNHRIVGQLHGGWAACGNDLADFYGKFSLSWNNGSLAAERLSDWLDPNGTSGTTLDGFDPNSQHDIAVQTIQLNHSRIDPGDNFTVTSQVKNIGTEIEYNIPIVFSVYKPNGQLYDQETIIIN